MKIKPTDVDPQPWVKKTGDTMSGDLLLDSDSSDIKVTVSSVGYANVFLNGDKNNTSGEPGGAGVVMSTDGGLESSVIAHINMGGTDGAGGSYTGSTSNSMLIGTISNRRIDFGTGGSVKMTLQADGRLQLPSFLRTALPSASTAGCLIYVSNATGGAAVAFSNGSNWISTITGSAV